MLFSLDFRTFFCYAVYFFCMTNLRQIVDVRQCMDFFDNMEQTLCMLCTGSADQALAVVDIAKDDSIRRTGLLAGCLNVCHIFKYPVLFLGFQLAFLETLYTERTLFH